MLSKAFFIAKPKAGAMSLCDKSGLKQGLAYPRREQGAALNGEGPREAPGSSREVFLAWGKQGPSSTRPAAALLPSAAASLPQLRAAGK